MRKAATILFLLMLCMPNYAQKKLFNNAIEAGRKPDGFYILQNDKSRMVKLEDLEEYASKNDIILGKSTSKTINRFGDIDTSIATLEFLPKSEFVSYIFSNINRNYPVNLTLALNKGSAYCFMGWDKGEKVLTRLNDLTWSGITNNGMLEGKGVAFYQENSRIIYVESTFKNGFPSGVVNTYVYDTGGTFAPYMNSRMTAQTLVLGQMSEGLASIEKNGIYGFVDDKGYIVISPKYQKVLRDYDKGQAIVEDSGKDIVIDRIGNFVDWGPQQKRVIAQAKEDNALGEKYYNGNGVEKDYYKAAGLFLKSAEAENADGQYNYGECLFYGDGVAQDQNAAIEYYRLAAKQNHMEAQYSLGYCYSKGKGVQQNLTTAFEWYYKAAKQGHVDAMNELGKCYKNGEGVTKNASDAVYWFKKAMDQGNTDAIDNLGMCYEKGEGVDQDYGKAVELYERAAKQDDAWGQYHLGCCYLQGNGVPQDLTTALEWIKKSAEQGNEEALETIISLKEEVAKELKRQHYTELLGYDPKGTSITTLVSSGRKIDAVIEYLNEFYVEDEDWFINMISDNGREKTYKLYIVTDTDDDGTRHGSLKADISATNGKIDLVLWQ